MRELPTDPYAFQARVFDALCNDLFDMASGKASSCERTNALRHISTARVGSRAQKGPDGSNVVRS